MEPISEERRRAERLACRIPVRVRASGRILHARTEDLSRVGALLHIPLAEIGLPPSVSLDVIGRETTSILGEMATLELHYEILGNLVKRAGRPVRIGRCEAGQAFVEIGCAFGRSLTDNEVEFLGIALPPVKSEVAPDDAGALVPVPTSARHRSKPAVDSPLSVVVCAPANGEAIPFAAAAEVVDRYGAHATLDHISALPILPERPGVSGLLTALANTYGNDPWVVLMREGQPVWSGGARLQAVELGPDTGRVDLQLGFSRSLTVPERTRLKVG